VVNDLIADAERYVTLWRHCTYASAGEELTAPQLAMEDRHQVLFQALWTQFNDEEYAERIDRFFYRLQINGLADGFLCGKRVIDVGCGHGNFAHALLRAGAESVVGVDFGAASIAYAIQARDRLGMDPQRLTFVEGSAYALPVPDGEFDVAIQNGVFHHLDDEDAAYREVARVLKPGGWFWVYTDGSGAISHALWDASVHILRDVPRPIVLAFLDSLGLSAGKRYHLGDGLSATYRHTTARDLLARLERHGFGQARRIRSDFPTDFDDDVIAQDRWGREKFGEGDLRYLVQKV
jgi:SAM-dependent methyltransferase